jgi:hypothetical protein
MAHNREQSGVVIEEDASVGTGAIILPNVTIGRGAASNCWERHQIRAAENNGAGNPARPIATVEIPLGLNVSVKEFAKGLRPIRGGSGRTQET